MMMSEHLRVTEVSRVWTHEERSHTPEERSHEERSHMHIKNPAALKANVLWHSVGLSFQFSGPDNEQRRTDYRILYSSHCKSETEWRPERSCRIKWLYSCYVFPALINSLVCWSHQLQENAVSTRTLKSHKSNNNNKQTNVTISQK